MTHNTQDTPLESCSCARRGRYGYLRNPSYYINIFNAPFPDFG
jgi:hypothetical protein